MRHAILYIVSSVILGQPSITQAANLPTRESGRVEEYCKDSNTKRGELDIQMYNHCIEQEIDGYNKMVDLATKYSSTNWIQDAINFSVREWTKAGIRRDRMVAYELGRIVDSFEDLVYESRQNSFNRAKYESCYKFWGIQLTMVVHCYKEAGAAPSGSRRNVIASSPPQLAAPNDLSIASSPPQRAAPADLSTADGARSFVASKTIEWHDQSMLRCGQPTIVHRIEFSHDGKACTWLERFITTNQWSRPETGSSAFRTERFMDTGLPYVLVTCSAAIGLGRQLMGIVMKDSNMVTNYRSLCDERRVSAPISMTPSGR